MEAVTERILERRFEVGATCTLDIETVAGSIRVRAGDDGVIMVHAEKSGSAHSADNTRIDIEQADDRVLIRTRQRGTVFGLGSLVAMSGVRYEIEVPHGCVVRAKGVSASIDVAGTSAPVELSTISGRIELEDAVGEIGLKSVSGSIRAEALAGATQINSTSGRVEVRASRLETFNVHTVSGRIELATPLISGQQYAVRTVSGSVRIEVPPETGATVTLKTVSGDATFDLPAQVIKSGRRSWQGILNGGGANLEVHSVSGSLRIVGGGTNGQGEAAHVDSTPSAASAEIEETRLQILRRLQQGEITLDQASRELGDLE